MKEPNLGTLVENGETFGLHKWKTSMPTLCVQHACGDWITLRAATPRQIEVFRLAKNNKEKLK